MLGNGRWGAGYRQNVTFGFVHEFNRDAHPLQAGAAPSDRAPSVRFRRQASRVTLPLRTTSSAEDERRGCDLLKWGGVRMGRQSC